MEIRIGKGIPLGLTSERIKNTLDLSEDHERQLEQALDARASQSWVATDQESNFYDRVRALFSTPEGRLAYDDARSDFEHQYPEYRGSTDLLTLLKEDREIASSDESYSDDRDHEFEHDFVHRLAEINDWSRLAETLWAESLLTGTAKNLLNALAVYPAIFPQLEAVIGALGKESSNILSSHESQLGAGQLVDRVKQMVEQLDAADCKDRELQVISLDLLQLTDVARTENRRRNEVISLQVLIEDCEQRHPTVLAGESSIRDALLLLKSQVGSGSARLEFVSAVLEHVDALASLEDRKHQLQEEVTTATQRSEFEKVRTLIDGLESLSKTATNAQEYIESFLSQTSVTGSSSQSEIEITPSEESAPDTPEPTESDSASDPQETEEDTSEEEATKGESVGSSRSDDDSENRVVNGVTPETTEDDEDDQDRHQDQINEAIRTAINANRFGIAYHLARSSSGTAPCASTIRLIASNYITDRSVHLRTELSDATDELLNRWKARAGKGSGDCRQRDEAVLVACAALLPALKAPDGLIAQLLATLEPHLGDMPSLRKFVKTAGTIALEGNELPLSALREDDSLDRWQEREEAIQVEVAAWLKNESRAKFTYLAATNVWRRMLENWQQGKRSSLGHLIDLLRQPAETIDVDKVRELTEHWRTDHDKEIDRIDREKRSSKSTKKIVGLPRTALRQKIGQALALVERRIAVHKERPGKRPAFPTQQAKKLRTAAISNVPLALEELSTNSIEYECSAVKLLKHYLLWFQNPSPQSDDRSIGLTDLLHAELHADPRIEFGSSGHAIDSSIEISALLTLLHQTEFDYAEPALQRAQRGDFSGAEATLEFAEVTGQIDDRSADLARNKINDERSRVQEELEQRIKETRNRLDSAYASGAISPQSHEWLSAQIPILESAESDRFTVHISTLDQIDNQIHKDQQGRRDSLIKSLIDLSGISAEDKKRIEDAINSGLFQIAEDFIERLGRKELLPESSISTDRPFDRFFPDFVEEITSFSNDGEGVLSVIRSQLESKASTNFFDFSTLSDTARRDSIGLIDAWLELRTSQTTSAALKNLLRAVGFVDAATKGTEERTHDNETIFELRTEATVGPDITQLPDFGSGAKGVFRLLTIRNRISQESVIGEAQRLNPVNKQPTLVIFLDTLDVESRRGMAAEFLSGRYNPTIVLDEVLVAFLATFSRNRLGTFFDCATAFTYSQPYDPDVADVPPEMFFGRTEARKAILATSGDSAHFLYGGRRLGKTALLSSVEREYRTRLHQEPEQFVRLINLKGTGIGSIHPTEDLWKMFADHLAQTQILQQGTFRHETIEKRINEWLEVDPGRRILFLIDEADAFLDAERKKDQSYRVLDQIKKLMEQTERRFKVVFAGLHNVQRAARDPNTPLAHLGEAIRIGPMLPETDHDEIRRLIRNPLEALGCRFTSNDSIIRIAAETIYYPALVQQFCKELLKKVCVESSLVDAPGPPYMIDPDTVERVFNAKETRDRIQQLFSWTIELDTRYEFLTYLIARESFDNVDTQPRLVPIAEIRELALAEWRECFASDSSYWMFEVLLEEMVGLGILRENDDKQYAIRTRNLRMLLGNDEEIERRFEDAKTKSPPVDIDPSQFRSTMDGDYPSSLTADQERRLLSGRHAVGFVFGTKLAGLERISDSLKQIGSRENAALYVEEATPPSMRLILNKLIRGQKQGIHIVLLDTRGTWNQDLIEYTIALIGEYNFQNRIIRPVFLCGPQETWNWLKCRTPVDRNVEQHDIWLGPCAIEFARRWLREREALAYSSMEIDSPWPTIVGSAAEHKQLQSITEVTDTFWSGDSKNDYFGDILISPLVEAGVRILAAFPDDGITADLLSELASENGTPVSPEEALEIFDWAGHLGIVHKDGIGYRLDSTYAKGIDKAFGG